MNPAKGNWLRRLGRWVRLHLIRAVRENASPLRSAMGFGLGAFIGVFPSFTIGTPLAYFAAGRLNLNRAAAVAGTIIMNPLTAPFLYSASTWLGLEILRRDGQEVVPAEGILAYINDYGVPFLLGNTLVALALGIAFGLTAYVVITRVGRRGMRTMLMRNGSSQAASSTRATP